jgi:serine/threonine-protein kinase RsbW
LPRKVRCPPPKDPPVDAMPFTLTLPTDARMVSVARSFVEAVCHACNVDRSATYALVLATGEAVSNIIRHAHQNRPEAQFQILCHAGPDCLEIRLEDDGDPFNLETVPRLDPTELRLGGRGVFLMRSLLDEVSCTPRQPRGNVLRLVKRFSSESSIRECG